MSLNVRGLSSPAVECRSGGPTMIVVTFDRPIMALSGDSTRDVQLSSGQVTGEIVDGIQLYIFLANVADANTLFIMFPGIVNPVDYSPVGQALCFRVLAGDVNGDGRTNSLDLLGVRKNINQITTATTLRPDVNADGLLNVFDLLIVRNSLNRLTVGVCP